MSVTRSRQPERRSLTHVGGPVDTAGDEELARGLAEALDVSSSRDDEDAARAHVHGFHAYPARMHPFTAGKLVRLVAAEKSVVLDPFCGSGTVVAEAMIAGREAAGSDLNPIALELTTVKTRPRSDDELEALVARAREIAAPATSVARTARAPRDATRKTTSRCSTRTCSSSSTRSAAACRRCRRPIRRAPFCASRSRRSW